MLSRNLILVLLILFIPVTMLSPAAADSGQPQGGIHANEKFLGDYDELVKARIIRALVPYSKTFYFLDGATVRGIAYDNLREFEKGINKKLKNKHLKVHVVIIPTARHRLFDDLQAGLGDLAVGNLTITPERLKRVDFSDPMLENVDEVVVTGEKEPKLSHIDDLAGREIHVRKSSSHYESLLALNEKLKKDGKKGIKIIPADENLEDEDLLEMVNAGVIPMIVMDSHKAAFWGKIFTHIKINGDVKVNSGGKIAWAMRKNSPKLKAVVNAFVKQNKKGTLMGNMLFKRYLQNTKYVKKSLDEKELAKFDQTISIFKKYGKQYDFDWLMLAALAYQESTIDQSKRSHVGAVGVMQILPTTAKDKNVNISNIGKIEPNIHAGTKYLRFMMDRYFADEKMDKLNKGLFAFASYNAGPAKVAKLRKEAERMGLDPNIWFRNVEVAAAKRIGRETVQYVSNIYKYYVAYKLINDMKGKK
jgi:membrane-bound lytic murein transglycosylase MltF